MYHQQELAGQAGMADPSMRPATSAATDMETARASVMVAGVTQSAKVADAALELSGGTRSCSSRWR